VVKDSIVGSGARIGRDARVDALSVVGEGATVPEGANVHGDRVEA
jgi:carbonic anhydrase/acetyltransferase-like protein (isoleucine patch superfamily)